MPFQWLLMPSSGASRRQSDCDCSLYPLLGAGALRVLKTHTPSHTPAQASIRKPQNWHLTGCWPCMSDVSKSGTVFGPELRERSAGMSCGETALTALSIAPLTRPRDRYPAAQLLPALAHRYPDLIQVIRVTRVRRCSTSSVKPKLPLQAAKASVRQYVGSASPTTLTTGGGRSTTRSDRTAHSDTVRQHRRQSG